MKRAMLTRMTRWGIGAAIVAVLVGIVFVADAVLDLVVEQAIETLGPAITGTSVEIEDVDLSIFDGQGSVKGMVIGNPRGFDTKYAFRLREVGVHLVPRSLFGEKVVIRDIHIDAPDINFEQKDGTNNLERILKHIRSVLGGGGGGEDQAEGEADDDGPEAIWEQLTEQKVQIDHFLMKDAQIHAGGSGLEDERLDIPPLSIELEGLGAGPDGESVARVSAKVMRRVSTRVSLAVAKRMLTLGLGGRDDSAKGGREAGAEDTVDSESPDATPDEDAPRRRHRRRP
jgi:hypothetical protein